MKGTRLIYVFSILVFLGLPFLTQIELFPFQKLSMFSTPLSEKRSIRYLIKAQGISLYHPATSYMLEKKPDCVLAKEALRTFFDKDTSIGGLIIIKEEIMQRDTLQVQLLACP